VQAEIPQTCCERQKLQQQRHTQKKNCFLFLLTRTCNERDKVLILFLRHVPNSESVSFLLLPSLPSLQNHQLQRSSFLKGIFTIHSFILQPFPTLHKPQCATTTTYPFTTSMVRIRNP